MKLVKLNRTHKIFRDDGCVYAWRFEGFCQEATRLEKILENRFGHQYSGKGCKKWASRYGANARHTFKIENLNRTYTISRSVYWVGIKDPVDLTFLLLKINDLQAS